jgi:uncharacterized protein (DUF983 family)
MRMIEFIYSLHTKKSIIYLNDRKTHNTQHTPSHPYLLIFMLCFIVVGCFIWLHRRRWLCPSWLGFWASWLGFLAWLLGFLAS